MKLITLFAILTFSVGASAKVAGSSLRGGASFNMGTADVKSEGGDRSEGPYGFNVNLEHSFSSRWVGGVDHLRSFQLSPMSTGVSVTSMYLKLYYYTPQPSVRPESMDPNNTSYFFSQDITPYFGLGAGFAQSSLVPKTDDGKSNSAVGVSVAIKNGIEIPLTGMLGLRSELNYTTTLAGVGNVSFLHLMFGFYYNL